MQFNPDRFYHVYNRGNRRIPIFYEERNYTFFLDKIYKHVIPHASLLAYCLMPNHFHLLIHTNANVDKSLNDEIGVLLRSYTRAINLQEGQTGSLFQSGTKAKELECESSSLLVCFNYIHLNPLRANMVSDLVQWPYSSFPFYSGLEENRMMSVKMTNNFLDIDFENYRNEIFEYLPYWDSYHAKI